MLEKVFNILPILLGLFFVIKWRALGKFVIQERKKVNKFLPESNFDGFAIVITQCGFFLIGMFFIIVGLAKLLQ